MGIYYAPDCIIKKRDVRETLRPRRKELDDARIRVRMYHMLRYSIYAITSVREKSLQQQVAIHMYIQYPVLIAIEDSGETARFKLTRASVSLSHFRS